MKKTLLIFFVLLFSFSGIRSSEYSIDKVQVPLTFDNYYTYEMTIAALEKLNKAYPYLTKLEVVGKSEEGRNIYAMIVSNPKTGNELDKPGIYVDGNIHGNEIQATEVTLYLLNYLLTNYEKNNEIKNLVDKKSFYIIPIVNVDGRYHFFKDANTSSSNRGLRRPKDDDNDGLVDEDFPDDLDGDGNICLMRKEDPFGNFKTDPEDPRLMIRTKPGEKGEWTLLGSEGIDNDGDGKVNEDSEGYVDPNRNWGFDWAPKYVQSGSGDYPFSGVGLKSISEFIMKKPNICMTWLFHNSGGMFLRGPSTKSQGEYPKGDVQVYDYLGNQAERIVPNYRYLIGWKDLYTTYGDFGEWMTMLWGTYNFVGELYTHDPEAFQTIGERKKRAKLKENEDSKAMFRGNIEKDRERLKFDDNLNQGKFFKEWKHYKHPVYGDIEIGGWVKMSTRVTPPFLLKDLVHRNASAVLFSAKHTPEISIKISNPKKIGKNLYRIRTALVNSKAMPTMSYHAKYKKLYTEDFLKVSGKGIKVIAGGLLQDKYRDKVIYKEYRPEIQFFTIPGFSKIDFQFLISGKGKVIFKYKSRHGGKIVKTIDLK
ncbi:MAG: M14 family metallopeptidase [Acidobacteriota bacterium]